MAKTNSGTKRSPTYFEQVPLEVVKQVAEIDGTADTKAGATGARVERASAKKRGSAQVSARSSARKGR